MKKKGIWFRLKALLLDHLSTCLMTVLLAALLISLNTEWNQYTHITGELPIPSWVQGWPLTFVQSYDHVWNPCEFWSASALAADVLLAISILGSFVLFWNKIFSYFQSKGSGALLRGFRVHLSDILIFVLIAGLMMGENLSKCGYESNDPEIIFSGECYGWPWSVWRCINRAGVRASGRVAVTTDPEILVSGITKDLLFALGAFYLLSAIVNALNERKRAKANIINQETQDAQLRSPQ